MSTSGDSSGIKGLHHNAYRCRDSEETRKFYEDFLGLPLAVTLRLTRTKTGRACNHLHTFYQLDDGSFLAFFDAPDMPFEFKDQDDFDLHIALEVSEAHMLAMREKGNARGLDVRGVSDHDFIHSIYFRDPNGYVVELTCRMPHHAEATDRTHNGARAKLDQWQREKARAAGTT
jgi:catechol 2,3-dioxygenase-like lactoylglutathione lyase family enzyme